MLLEYTKAETTAKRHFALYASAEGFEILASVIDPEVRFRPVSAKNERSHLIMGRKEELSAAAFGALSDSSVNALKNPKTPLLHFDADRGLFSRDFKRSNLRDFFV